MPLSRNRSRLLRRVIGHIAYIASILVSAYSEHARKIITAIVDFIVSKILFVIMLLVISPFVYKILYKIYCRWRPYSEPSFVLVRRGSLEFRGGEKTDTRKPCHAINKREHPVVDVTREDAESYCCWLNAFFGGTEIYRLPNELEWERAARGTRGRKFPWRRQKFSVRKCNSAESKKGDTTPVDYYESGRSRCGCYDMVGNVSEWTSSNDEYGLAVVRGSSYETDRKRSNCFFHILHPPDTVSDSIGFRVAREDNSRDS